WSTPSFEGLSTLSVGSDSQTILGRSGDDLRIDWGYLYIAAPATQKPQWKDHQLALELGSVGSEETACWLILAYDDLYSIQYMKETLRPSGRRRGGEAGD